MQAVFKALVQDLISWQQVSSRVNDSLRLVGHNARKRYDLTDLNFDFV